MGSPLTSTALTQDAANTALVKLTGYCFGIETDSSQSDYVAAQASFIRLEYPTDGEPDWGGVNVDVCFCTMTIEDTDLSKFRDLVTANGADETSVSNTYSYNRGWRAQWTFYGPNSLDNARTITSCLMDLGEADDILAASNLAIVTDSLESKRAPELFSKQWWERVDASISMNEYVVETNSDLTAGSIAINTSLQGIKLNTYGQITYGQGEYGAETIPYQDESTGIAQE